MVRADRAILSVRASIDRAAERVPPMHDLLVAVIFVLMLLGPCLVTLGGGKD